MEGADFFGKGRSGSNTSAKGCTTGGALASVLSISLQSTTSQLNKHKASHGHLQSFAENQRRPSFTQQAAQDLLKHPPTHRTPDPRFAGRDWRDVDLGELVSADEVRWADLDTSVEEATMTLLKNNPNNVVLVRESPTANTVLTTFDQNDLNAYLLVVVGLARPKEDQFAWYEELAKKAQSQQVIRMREVQLLCATEELRWLAADSTLDKAMEVFGSGVHRVLVTNLASEVVGVLNQLRLVEFFWNERVHFANIERLYGALLRDLQIGSQQIFAVNADAPLADALLLMHNEGLTSVAVVDDGHNVVGNISTADVRHLTSTASMPLLKASCMNFVGVILNERGVEQGRDSFPVFYVNPCSTLAHTVAKLVATQSHRVWVVESASPLRSAPATPLLQPTVPTNSSGSNVNTASIGLAISSTPTQTSGATVLVPAHGGNCSTSQSPLPGQSFSSMPASALPGAHLSGHLTGVVALTDILNLFARSTGLHPSDPSEQRARRRRSSSSSIRPSVDGARPSGDLRK